MTEIKSRYSSPVPLYKSTKGTLKDAVREAVKARVNLAGVDLSGAALDGVNLQLANLYGADLSKAYLRGAFLDEANLSEADLRGADLSGSSFYAAHLVGTNLLGARIDGYLCDGNYVQIAGTGVLAETGSPIVGYITGHGNLRVLYSGHAMNCHQSYSVAKENWATHMNRANSLAALEMLRVWWEASKGGSW